MAHRTRGQPWYASLSIDLIFLILKKSVFHPFVTALVPVCLRAVEIPYSDPAFRNTVYYAIFINILWILQSFDERVAYGKARKYDEEEETIVITGGASGLGHCLAEIYALKGTSVAVLDVRAPKDEVEGVDYYACDVSDTAAVPRAWSKIVDSLGTPTVLINNAGVVNSGPLLEASPAAVGATLGINTASHFHLASLFLDGLVQQQKPGTLVTVSSVLGRLGAARLSAYTASKAALIAYHKSVSAELRPHGFIKTILVTPGQLSTEMFEGVKQGPVQSFFGPVVEVQALALKMVNMIREGRGGVLAEPMYARWITVLDVLPEGVSRVLRDLAGVDTAIAP